MIKRKSNNRLRAKTKIRKTISGTSAKPRLSVYRSLNHVYAQLVDDTNQKTLLTVSTLSKELNEKVKELKGKVSKSKVVGSLLAERALGMDIKEVVFDRNGYRYHGRIKSLADGAREKGLKF
ncbi:MAG: 50S ribosomal protein L18 [Ignavibacteriaceae bacterium]|nr:50S ribosomal protein L18 [Ignavibacteriaceae bacterium]